MRTLFMIAFISLHSLIFADNNNIEKNSLYKGEMKNIQAGLRSLKENDLHKKICQKYGAIDETDMNDIQVSEGVLDVVVCFSPSKNKETVGVTLGSTPSTDSSIDDGPYLLTYVQSKQIDLKSSYWFRGSLGYYGAKSLLYPHNELLIEIGVPDDNCITNTKPLIDQFEGDYKIDVSCINQSIISPLQNYMKAYLDGVSSIAYGTIFH